MARRTIDLTGKLGLGERPQVVCELGTLEVDDSAATIMQVLALMHDGEDTTMQDAMDAARLLFGEDGYGLVKESGISFAGLSSLLTAAMQLAMGAEDGDEGNAETPATT